MASQVPLNQGPVIQTNLGWGSGTYTNIYQVPSGSSYLMIQNTCANDIFLTFGGAAPVGANNCFVLRPFASITFANFIPIGLIGAYAATGSNSAVILIGL